MSFKFSDKKLLKKYIKIQGLKEMRGAGRQPPIISWSKFFFHVKPLATTVTKNEFVKTDKELLYERIAI